MGCGVLILTGKMKEIVVKLLVRKETISFNVFEQQKLSVTKNGKTEIISFKPLEHVQ